MSKQVKVGVFVLVGLTLLALAIFMIGQNSRFWEPKVTYRAAFQNVSGLKPGSAVRTGGIDVGTVQSVGHAPEAGDSRIYVTFTVKKDEAPRIREDTVARVANKGLLGDKMIELSVSDGKAPPQDPNKLMQSEELRDMFAAADALAGKTQKVIERLEPLAQSLGDPKFAEDIKGTAANLRQITDAIANQDSVLHRLMYDPNEARKFDRALTNFSEASDHLNGLLADVHDVTTHVRTGPGIAHAVVYDGEISQNASGALAEVHKDLRAIREGNGLAHALLYGDDSTNHVMANLNAMSDDMRQIVAGVKAGKGTLGALLVDPSVYEDIKAAVGNVERNQVLRALVRYSIKQDEAKPHAEAPPSPPTPAPSSASKQP